MADQETPESIAEPLFHRSSEVNRFLRDAAADVLHRCCRDMLADLKTKGKVTRGWLGISIQDISDDIAKNMNYKGKNGALVSDVFKGDPADKAGIKEWDIILECNGQKITPKNPLANILQKCKIGEITTMKVLRDKKEIMLKVKLEEKI